MDSSRDQMNYGGRLDSDADADAEFGTQVSCEANPADLDNKDQNPQYTIQGVLHFLQTEWARLEHQRADWDIERAELKARIAFLEGDRRGQENLRQDLIRRIKMLEYALKQERVKFHQYQASVANANDQPGSKSEKNEGGTHSWGMEGIRSGVKLLDPGEKLALYKKQALETSAKWIESRSRLIKFLEEVGCTDALLTARQTRVLHLLKSAPEWRNALADVENKQPARVSMEQSNFSDEQLQSALCEMDEAIGDALVPGSVSYSDDQTEPDTTGQSYEMSDAIRVNRFRRTGGGHSSSRERQPPHSSTDVAGHPAVTMTTAVSSFITSLKSSEESDEFSPPGYSKSLVDKKISGLIDTLSSPPTGSSPSMNHQTVPSSDTDPRRSQAQPSAGRSGDTSDASAGVNVERSNQRIDLSKDQVPSDGLNLGDLANITVANESDSNLDSDPRDAGTQLKSQHDTNSTAKDNNSADASGNANRQPLKLAHTLRGHFDCIRSVAFHPVEPALFTASDDSTVMLWWLGKSSNGNQSKQSARAGLTADELEPVHVYHGHEGPVLCITSPANPVPTPTGQVPAAYSGGLDGTVRCWFLPPMTPETATIDLYGPFDKASTAGPVYQGDSSAAVWSICVHPSDPVLIAAHADGAVEVWCLNTSPETVLLRTIYVDQLISALNQDLGPVGRPTCVRYMVESDSTSASDCVIGTSTGWLLFVHVDAGQLKSYLPPPESSPSEPWNDFAFNDLASHPTLDMIIGAHEDNRIRFYKTDVYFASNTHVKAAMEQMNAHMDSVTSLAIDPEGLYLLTGSHDSSIRLWDIQKRNCIRDISNHRSKHKESVLSVAFHPRLPFAASAGADGVCKVYGIALGASRSPFVAGSLS